jgi:2-methylcitrate dehydratase PrpD
MTTSGLAAERIAGWSSRLRLSDVPENAVEEAKRCIVDLVGVTVAARNHPLCRAVSNYAACSYAPGPATLLVGGSSLSPAGAALVNGTAGHVLDFDDTSYTGIMHGSVGIFPAALAAAELSRGNGRTLLEAFIAGVEVTYAIASACTTQHYFKGWWTTATLGVFGAAAAAARALELSWKQTASALALAGAQSSGPKVIFGTDAKPYLAGRIAAIGVEAACLCERGIMAPTAIFEDKRGFISLLNDGIFNPAPLEELGVVWRLWEPGIFFKRYPVCSAAHAAVELLETLLSKHRLSAHRVRKVTCEIPPTVAISLVYDRPTTIQEAQFSLPFALAAILARGKLDLESMAEDELVARPVRDAMAKVKIRRVDSLHNDATPECARLTLHLDDGAEIQGYLAEPTGMPGNPMSNAALQRKFLTCLDYAAVPGEQAAALLENLLDLATGAPLSQCFEPLS